MKDHASNVIRLCRSMSLTVAVLLFAAPGIAQELNWHNSDSNNDGKVDHQDLFNLHQVWQQSGEPLAPIDLPWSVSGDDLYRVEGNVGIGSASPANKLDVKGSIRAKSPSSGAAVLLDSDADGGIAEVQSSAGNAAARVWVNDASDAKGGGLVTVNNPSGVRQTSLLTDSEGGVVAVESKNAQTVARVWTTATGEGLVTLNDADGVQKTNLYADPVGGILEARNWQEYVSAMLWVTDNGSGLLTLNNPEGQTRGQLSIHSLGSGDLRLDGPNGNENVTLASTGDNVNHGVISVHDSSGDPRAQMYVDSDGDGYVGAVNSKGTTGAAMTTDNSGRGILWANQTYSVADHPTQPGSKIVYNSLEGREAAIFCRGAVQLESGRGTIALPEDFVALAAPGTLTVQLTPGSLDSKGLAFEMLGKSHIEIGELSAGQGSYAVHYIVHAQRAGFEGQKTVMSEKEFKQAFLPSPQAAAQTERQAVRAPLQKAAARRLSIK